ncbi:fibrillin-1-like isoform X2 [Stegodyphus dumicola]|uniref:fibrillin-1-like isoform X2 n=1 Tax=Stegodyphus dumicola TaxID=202533 RepID=UPI0015AC9022|nr:fibrillin-1-like isoform X2 [Stegodyphus dumicola]
MRHNYGKYISLIVFFTAFVNGIYCDKLKNHSVGFKHIGFNSQVMKSERSGNESRNCSCGTGEKVCSFDQDKKKKCTCEEGFIVTKDEKENEQCTECRCGMGGKVCSFDKDKNKKCTCKEGFIVTKDEKGNEQCTDPCSTNPCQNGGKCHVTDEGLKCDCKHPYSGDKCEIDPCFTKPCKKGNTCKVNDGKMMCECNSPYEGIFCQAEADRCALLLAKGECNKEHETCYEGTCKCEKSYAYSKDGKACEDDICGKKSGIAVCPENAECNEITNGYECVCKKGFYQNSANCEKINPCSPGVSTCEQFCSPKDGKCACGDEFTLNKDNTTCKRKKSDDECLKNCGKGTCFKKNGEEDCICPNATHVRGDTGCEDYCTHESKSPPGMCPGDKCIPDEKFAFRCDCKDPYEMAEDGIYCKRKAMCRSGGGHAACSKENAKCQEDFADEGLGYKCVCDTGFVKADNGTCINACDLKNCEASRARCELNGNYEAVCKCPLLMTMGTDGMCTIVDNSYIAKLKVLKRKYEIHVERKQSKRSLEDTVDYAKLRGDFELSLKNVYSDYRDLKLLNCTDEGKELECNLELQLKKAASKNTINLIFQPSICIPLKDTSYCWIKPNLIVQIGKPEEVFHVANPCTEEIQKLCGPVASCKQLKNTSSFQCLCKDGFKSINTFHLTSLSTIEICEDIDECQEQTSCPNNTECFNIFGSYDCQCKQGYRPTETKSIKESGCIAVCDPNPCKHGECVQFGNHGFLCSCDEEYGGAFCNSTNELVKKVKKSGVTKAAVVGVVLGLILAVVLIGGYMYFRTDRKESHEYAQNANQNVFPYMRGRDSSGRNLGTAAQNSGHMGAESGQRDTMRSKLRRSLDKSKLVPNVRWSRHSDGEYTEIIDGIVEGDIENQNRSFSKSSDHLGK